MLSGSDSYKGRPLPSLPPLSDNISQRHVDNTSVSATPPPLPPRKVSSGGTLGKNSLSSEIVSSRKSYIEGLYHVPRQHDNQLPTYDTLSKSTLLPPVPHQEDARKGCSSSLTLKQVIEQHQNEFPLEVAVTAGYFGESEQDTFSEGDRLNFHFVKHISVAILETFTGRTIKVPLNSALQFSVLYNPKNDLKEATTVGYTFKSVKELLMQMEMPRLVCVTKQHTSSNVTHSVEKGEILVIDEVKHGRFGGQSLLCTPFNSNKQKRLSESCQGFFSTKPEELKLFLPDLINKLGLPLKLMVVADSVPGKNEVTPHSLLAINEIVNVTAVEKETTIIATPSFETEDHSMEDGNPITFDIPVDLKIMEVQIVKPNCDKLYEDTRNLFESYDPCKQVRIGNKEEDLYYTSIRSDQRNFGVELLPPESIYADRSTLLDNVVQYSEDTTKKLDLTIGDSANNKFDDDCLMCENSTSTLSNASSNMEDTPLYLMSRMMENVQNSNIMEDISEIKKTLHSIQQQLEGEVPLCC